MAKIKTGINVTLRQRKSSAKGRTILYLDFYPGIDGTDKEGNPIKTRREYLGLFVYDHPRNPFDRDHNTKVMEEATMKWLRRKNELNKPEIYNELEIEHLRKKEIGEGSFTDFLKNHIVKHKYSSSINIVSFEKHLCLFAKDKNLTFADITEKFCNEFKDYLLTAKRINSDALISQNTANLYFSLFKVILNKAHKTGSLPVLKLGSIDKEPTRRNYLTIGELNKLAEASCFDPVIKRAALFSALTGLRFSDIEKLAWDEVEAIGDNRVLKFTQRKTGGIETLPISQQAVDLMGDRDQAKPFAGLRYGANKNTLLKNWVKSAGISKKITFHCFRHTYATLQLSAGTDIYTVSKLLGHRDLKTTQIYAHVLDDAKRDAVNRIILDL